MKNLKPAYSWAKPVRQWPLKITEKANFINNTIQYKTKDVNNQEIGIPS